MKKKLRYIPLLVIMVLLISLVSGCGASDSTSTPPSSGTGDNSSKVETRNWRLASVWPDGTFLIEPDKHFAELVGKMSNGRLNIQVYGVGELAAANQVLDTVSNGTVEAGADWPAYWSGKNTAFDLLGSNVLGFSQWDYFLWINEGGGAELYDEMYGKYNVKYFPTALSGMESGIRSNKPINSLDDLKGMKIRMAGLIQSKLIERFGATPASIAVDELYESLQRGVIDATEYSCPTNDDIMKIQDVTKYWLTPGWHQTSSVYGVLINKDEWNSLPDDLKAIVEAAAKATQVWMTAKYNYGDAAATNNILEAGVETTRLSDADMKKLENAKNEILEQLAAENPDYAKVLKSQIEYLKMYEPYREATGEWGFGRNWETYPDVQ